MPRWLIVTMVVGVTVALDIVLHMLTADFLPLPDGFTGSVLVQQFGFGPVALAWAIFAFAGMAAVYLRIEHRLPGSGLRKGLRYGIAVGLVVQVAMIEGVAIFGNRFVDEWVVGMADAVPIVVMGALLGHFVSDHAPRAQAAATRRAHQVGAVATFAAVFVAGRLGLQLAGVIDSALLDRPGVTVAWTIAMGVTIGVFHRLLGGSVAELALARRTVAFGLGVFGVNWALFMAFVPMVLPDSLGDVVLRVGVDIGFVTLACLLVNTRSRFPVRGTPGARGHSRARVG